MNAGSRREVSCSRTSHRTATSKAAHHISPEETVGTSILLEYHQLPTGTLLWEGLVHFILRVTRMPCFFLSEACDELFNSAAGFISANARDKVARVGFWLCVRDGQRSSM